MARSRKSLNPVASALICFFIGLIIILMGVVFMNDVVEEDERMDEETKGTIVDVYKHKETRRSGKRRKTYTYYRTTASYTVGDVEYTVVNELSHPRNVGDKITVYFNSSLPSDATLIEPGQTYGPIMFMGFGGVVIVFGILIAVTPNKKKRQLDSNSYIAR